nr:uncharacterized protein LOC112718442 isoform X1 [Arachis hypogaea]
MAKKSYIGIGTLMRKKLSDITNNSDSQHNLLPLPLPAIDADIPSIQQLLTERTQLIQLIAEKDELIESNGAELRRIQADIKKLQLQNRNLAQSNSLMSLIWEGIREKCCNMRFHANKSKCPKSW